LHFLGLFLSLHLPPLNNTFFSEKQSNNFQLSIFILSLLYHVYRISLNKVRGH
jgi:hypothetical protein